jgi:hypothetical protein
MHRYGDENRNVIWSHSSALRRPFEKQLPIVSPESIQLSGPA